MELSGRPLEPTLEVPSGGKIRRKNGPTRAVTVERKGTVAHKTLAMKESFPGERRRDRVSAGAVGL